MTSFTSNMKIFGAVPLSATARIGLLLAVLFGITFAYFSQDTRNHNAICRAALAANIVQDGATHADGYEVYTDDISVIDGVYYCDKAPGITFMALPVAAAISAAAGPVTVETVETKTWDAFVILSTLISCGLLSAAAGYFLYRHILARTNDAGAAIIAAVAFALGTPVFGWATAYFGHAASAATLLMGYVAFDTAIRRLKAGETFVWSALAGGVAFGASTAMEYTSLIPALVIGGVLAATINWRTSAVPAVKLYGLAAAGGVIALIPVLVYHNAAFGSPFSFGYSHPSTYQDLKSGFFGIAIPDPGIIGELIAGTRRGFIWYAPVMLAALWAAFTAIRRPEVRTTAIISLLVLLWFVLMNAGFTYWRGGFSTGPRYLTPALGFMMVMLGLAWPYFSKPERIGALALLVLSVAINLAATAVGMAADESMSNPLTQYVLPGLLAGEVWQTLSYRALGGSTLLHLVPLLAVWGATAWLIVRELRRLAGGDARPSQAAGTAAAH